MAEILNVVIGIQARSTSTRFPRKAFAPLGNKPMLQHVIDTCESAAYYLNKRSLKARRVVSTVILVPKGDEIALAFKRRQVFSWNRDTVLFEGPEQDVLGRYHMMAECFNPDFIVRVTADCPFIHDGLISKHINTATMNRLDYTSNVFEGIRTAPDGFDCEVFSKALLEYAHENATDPYDREHVTTFMRRERPAWAQVGNVTWPVDMSKLKYSIDTPEELEAANEWLKSEEIKLDLAERLHGKNSIFRY